MPDDHVPILYLMAEDHWLAAIIACVDDVEPLPRPRG